MEKKVVEFTPHAKDKLRRLSGLGVTAEKVVEILKNPEDVSSDYFGRRIAQSSISRRLALRVMYEEKDNRVLVITLYPCERGRYG